MAQPTETERRFEVSERSSALPVPALSRYARPTSKTRRADAPRSDAEAGSTEIESEAATGAAAARADSTGVTDVPLEAAADLEDLLDLDALRDTDPIVQAADEEWATDPSPPQPVHAARRTDSPRGGTEPARARASQRAGAHRQSVRSHDPLPPERREPSAADTRDTRNLPALRDDGPQSPPPRAEQRVPFWKRLSMTRTAAPAPPPAAAISPDLLKPVLERIDHLTRRFEREQKALHERLDQFEHNITRLWELEEQMGLEEVRAQLAVIQANQEEIADGVHALARKVAIAGGLGVAAIAGLLIWALL